MSGVLWLWLVALGAAPAPDYLRDVRPILQARCVSCHGPTKQMSGLRLDQPARILAGGASGQPTVTPGKPDESRLLAVISGRDAVSMPPAGERLSAEEVATLTAWIAAGAPVPEPVDYLTRIQPILEAKCYSCHGPDQQQGGLRLDTADGLLGGGDSGTPAVAAGNPEGSELLARVTSREPTQQMPPIGPRLRAAEVEALRGWIAQGAPLPAEAAAVVTSDHWAFQPRAEAAPPAVDARDWARRPLDAFILHELEQRGLEPSPEADRRTLIRRLHLDLLGLPPAPERVEAFAADASPDAYERLVDELLASPHFGERWARYWLDLARYADSDGYEKDNPRPHAWRWRDWVIDAINRDLPFDQFTIEQLAGDLLPEATLEQRVATGFHRNTLTNREGGVDAEQYRVEQIVDRTNTTGTVWLGLTVACAHCHTHKYDPLTQREYFGLYAFFNDADERDETAPTPGELAAFNEAAEQHRAETAELTARIEADTAAYEHDRLAAAQAGWEAEPDRWEPNWRVLEPTRITSSAGGTTFERLPDRTFRAGEAKPDRDVYEITAATNLSRITALRLRLLADDALPQRGPGRAGNGNLVVSEVELALLPAGGDPVPLTLASAVADHSQDGYAVGGAIDGMGNTGWALLPQIGTDHEAVFTLAEPAEIPAGARLRVRLSQQYGGAHTIGKFDLAWTDQPGDGLAAPAETWHQPAEAEARSVGGPTFTARDDRAILVGGDGPESDTYTVTARVDGPLTGLRLEALPDPSLGANGPGRTGHGNFVVTEVAASVLVAGEAKPLTLRAATSDHDQRDFPVVEAIDGERGDTQQNGWAIMPQGGARHRAVFEIVDAPALDGPAELTVRLDQLYGSRHTLGCFRLSVTGDAYPIDIRELTDELRLALRTARAERTPEQQTAIDGYYRGQDPFLAEQRRRLAERDATAPKPPETMAQMLTARAEPRATTVHIRGDFLRPGAPVEPTTPAVLPKLAPRGARPDRLDLARWLVDPANPLPARVEVNRVWRNLFGTGLVRTPEDFGTRGEPPTHPALLDYLAGEFIRGGWSRKALVREIVTSATYRQSSHVREDLRELDPENRLLARQNRFRVEAELLRDANLAVSGLLNPAVGGPSVRPPLPAGMTNLSYANGMRWEESQGADRYRRGLYIFFQRTVPYPLLMTFDSPDSNTACTRRERSNTPLQALTLLNDPVLYEGARRLARRLMTEAADTPSRIQRAFALCYGRPPSDREQATVERLHGQMHEAVADVERARQVAGEPTPADADLRETATWVTIARVLLNTDEFLTRE